MKKEKMNILFVCKHNVFRSQLSLAYFKKINKNKNIKAFSGGIFSGHDQSPNQKKAAREILGVKPVIKPKTMSTNYMNKMDLIILCADDIPLSLFKGMYYAKKVVRWKIRDVWNNDYKSSVKTIKNIKKHVERLVKQLENV